MARAVLPHGAYRAGVIRVPRAMAGLDSAFPDPGGDLSGLPSAASRAKLWGGQVGPRDRRSESQVTAARVGWGPAPSPPIVSPGSVLTLPYLAWRRNP